MHTDSNKVETPLEKEERNLMCPLNGEILVDAVLADDGYTYERRWIENYFKISEKNSSPYRIPLKNFKLTRSRDHSNRLDEFVDHLLSGSEEQKKKGHKLKERIEDRNSFYRNGEDQRHQDKMDSFFRRNELIEKFSDQWSELKNQVPEDHLVEIVSETKKLEIILTHSQSFLSLSLSKKIDTNNIISYPEDSLKEILENDKLLLEAKDFGIRSEVIDYFIKEHKWEESSFVKDENGQQDKKLSSYKEFEKLFHQVKKIIKGSKGNFTKNHIQKASPDMQKLILKKNVMIGSLVYGIRSPNLTGDQILESFKKNPNMFEENVLWSPYNLSELRYEGKLKWEEEYIRFSPEIRELVTLKSYEIVQFVKDKDKKLKLTKECLEAIGYKTLGWLCENHAAIDRLWDHTDFTFEEFNQPFVDKDFVIKNRPLVCRAADNAMVSPNHPAYNQGKKPYLFEVIKFLNNEAAKENKIEKSESFLKTNPCSEPLSQSMSLIKKQVKVMANPARITVFEEVIVNDFEITYRALRNAQATPSFFKSNLLEEESYQAFSALDYEGKYSFIKAHARAHPNGRTAKALDIVLTHRKSNNNYKLFKAIYLGAFQASFFSISHLFPTFIFCVKTLMDTLEKAEDKFINSLIEGRKGRPGWESTRTGTIWNEITQHRSESISRSALP